MSIHPLVPKSRELVLELPSNRWIFVETCILLNCDIPDKQENAGVAKG